MLVLLHDVYNKTRGLHSKQHEEENPSITPLTFHSYRDENARYRSRPSIKQGSNECDEQKIFHVPHVIVVNERVRVDVNQ